MSTPAWFVVPEGDERVVYVTGPEVARGSLHVLELSNRADRVLDEFGSDAGAPIVMNETIVATDENGTIRAASAHGGPAHLLLGHDSPALPARVDDRTVVTGSFDGQLRIWDLPDLEKTPFHLLARDEILAKLRAFTNYRVVRDDAAPMGYHAELAPFPGWESTPDW